MISFQIDPAAQLVTCTVSMDLRVLDIADLIGHLFTDHAFDPAYNTMIVVSDSTVVPDVAARSALAELLLAWRKMHVPAKWAIVVPGSGWHRLVEHLIAQYDFGAKNVRCFRERAAALAWYEEEASPVAAAYG